MVEKIFRCNQQNNRNTYICEDISSYDIFQKKQKEERAAKGLTSVECKKCKRIFKDVRSLRIHMTKLDHWPDVFQLSNNSSSKSSSNSSSKSSTYYSL